MIIEGPILAAILSAIVGIAKAIWDVASKAASRAAFYFATVVPMIIRWFVQNRLFLLSLIVLIFGIIRSVIVAFWNVISSSGSFSHSLAYLERNFSWMYWLLIHGPLALDVFYHNLLTQVIPLFLSIGVLKWTQAIAQLETWILKQHFKKS